MKWGALVPLVGGMLVGAQKAIGTPPDEIASWDVFAKSDSYSARRWPNARRVMIDSGDRLSVGLDMVTSVCPCAGLSMLNVAKTGSASRAKTNEWMFKAAEYVLGEAKPTVYMGENAPALFTKMGRDVANGLIEVGKKHGYGTSFVRTNSRSHGNPQNRIRTFYYFWKNSTSPSIEVSTTAAVTASEYLSRLPASALATAGAPLYDLSIDPVYRYLTSKFGDRWRAAGQDANPYRDAYALMGKHQMMRDYLAWCDNNDVPPTQWQRRIVQRIVNGEGVFSHPLIFDKFGTYPTLTKKVAPFAVHPDTDRCLTIREMSWLMGLPEDDELPGKRDYNVLFQNVTVESAQSATKIVVDWMGGKSNDTGADVAWFDATKNGMTTRVA